MPATGDEHTKLIVLRGNSGSGKSATARALRERAGLGPNTTTHLPYGGIAWVEQDYFRRIILRERDVVGGANIGLIAQAVRYALDHRYHVILEGILYTCHYAQMLEALDRDHVGETTFYYFDISFAETVRRHETKPIATEVSVNQLREWYVERDLLEFTTERLITEAATLEQTVDQIATETRLRPSASIVEPSKSTPTGLPVGCQ